MLVSLKMSSSTKAYHETFILRCIKSHWCLSGFGWTGYLFTPLQPPVSVTWEVLICSLNSSRWVQFRCTAKPLVHSHHLQSHVLKVECWEAHNCRCEFAKVETFLNSLEVFLLATEIVNYCSLRDRLISLENVCQMLKSESQSLLISYSFKQKIGLHKESHLFSLHCHTLLVPNLTCALAPAVLPTVAFALSLQM
jgi:hypothetical protein